MSAILRNSSSLFDAVVVINPSAAGGTALQRWMRVREAVQHRLRRIALVFLTPNTDLEGVLRMYRREGFSSVVAAGGDGTVNTVLQALMSMADTDKPARLGALALGSSNDFHKPFQTEQMVKGISCRLDFSQTKPRDIGLLEYEDSQGKLERRYWIVNAGLGVTADANALFNHPDDTLSTLKSRWTGAAIGYAALRTILNYRSQNRLLKIADGPALQTAITNLAVVKSPHFSGSFHYDSPFEPSSGRFFVHLCEGMSTARTLVTLGHLSRGRFQDLPATRSCETDRLQVAADTPFSIEFDGEVIESRRVVFSLADKRLEVCRQ